MSVVIVLNTLEDAQREIDTALSQGDVCTALASAQCLWALCDGSAELENCLEGILASARRFVTKFTPDDRLRLSMGLSEVRLSVSRERLLASAAA